MTAEGDELARHRRIAATLSELRGLLKQNPRLAGRTQAMLTEELPCPDLEEPMNEVQISMRLPADLLERAERLVPRLQKDPALRLWRISRQAVIRLALTKGLEALEGQYAGQTPVEDEARTPRRRKK